MHLKHKNSFKDRKECFLCPDLQAEAEAEVAAASAEVLAAEDFQAARTAAFRQAPTEPSEAVCQEAQAAFTPIHPTIRTVKRKQRKDSEI